MGIKGSFKFVRGVHHLTAEGRRCVANQGDMISKLLRVTSGRLSTGVGQQSNDDDVADAVLFQLQIEVRVGEPA